jgi:amino acid transporter
MSDERAASSKSMNLWSATSIGVGAMIGAGIFALIGIAVEIAGPLAYLAFVIAGVSALLTSYSVAKLAVQFPTKGGRVEFLNRGYGTGVFSGALNLIMWMGYAIVTSLYARAFGQYATALVRLEDSTPWLHVFASAIVVLFVLINFVGAAAVGKSELLIVSVKVAVMLLFGLVGLMTMDAGRLTVTSGQVQLGGLILASGVVFMSYEGFGLVANTAEDVEDPGTTIPRALFLSIAIVVVIYVLVSVSVIGNLSIDRILEAKEYALAEAAKPVLGGIGFTIMGIAALLSTASAINATIYGPVHMLQETAKAGQICRFFMRPLFGHRSGQALAVTGATVLVVANLLDLRAIAATGSLIFLVIYTAVNVANLRLRQRTASRPWIVWLGILCTAFSFLALLYFQVREGAVSAAVFGLIVVVGFVYEWWYQRAR